LLYVGGVVMPTEKTQISSKDQTPKLGKILVKPSVS
jgi:hypothetical protein